MTPTRRLSGALSGALLVLLVLCVPRAGAQPACPPVAGTPTPAEVQEAAKHARDRGALWRFEKDGRHGYLYGSIHVGKLEWAVPGRTVAQAIRDAETIAIEADPLDPRFRADVMAPQKPAEAPALPPALVDRLRAQATRACVPWERLQGMPPMMIVTTLTLLDVRWEGLYVDYATELVLAAIAKAAGKDVATLETAAVQRAAIIGSNPPAEQLASIEALVLSLENGASRKEIVAIADAWASGDLDALALRLVQPAERAMLERSVFSRNPGIAARIEELHRAGRRVFVATGILHMVGDSALQKLLAERGFTIERLRLDGR